MLGDPDFITVFSLSFELGRYNHYHAFGRNICFYASSELPSHPTFKKHYNRGISLCKIAKSLCNGMHTAKRMLERLHHRLSKFDRFEFLILKPICYFFGVYMALFLSRIY